MTIRSARDFWSGAMFLAIGAVFAIAAWHYPFGNSAEPGPGYFPFGLGVILTLLGAAGMWRGLGRREGRSEGGEAARLGPTAWRPLLFVCLAVAAFGFTLPRYGIFVALPLAVVVAALGGDEFRWGEALATAAVLTAGSWLIFVWGLQLSIPVWPGSVR